VILVYTPAEGDEKRWDLSEVKVTFAEAKAAEKAGGFSWRELDTELNEGNVSALQAALWVLRKRDETNLRFADLEDLPVDAAHTEYSDDEREFMRAHIEGNADMSREEKDAALTLLGFDPSKPAKKAAPKGK
jgi:hypothetical protein